jgi:hypothetical protein
MKCVSYGTTVTLGLMLILSTVIPAHSGMMGQRQMGQPAGAAEASPRGMMGMMGGGRGGQPQSPMQMAGGPQNLTQEDTQRAVTVNATLLTPDKPRADGKLAVQL